MNITRDDLGRYCPQGDGAWLDAFAQLAHPLTETIMTKVDFESLRADYADRWAAMRVRPGRQSAVDAAARTILRGRARYEAVSAMTGVPWHVIGLLHLMENSCGWGGHLHNGDTLARRTFHVPKGRPVSGKPPFTWEASACDALAFDGLTAVTSWPVERIAFELEKYNGLGYRLRGLPSPYLWSFSDQYTAGKFGADGDYDPALVSAQVGAMPALQALMRLAPEIAGHVAGQDATDDETSATPVATPVSAPVAEPVVVKGASRKWTMVAWLRGMFGVGAGGAAGYNAMDSVQTTQSYLSVFKAFAAEWGVAILILVCVGGYILTELIHHYSQEDAAEGRYVPSRSEP